MNKTSDFWQKFKKKSLYQVQDSNNIFSRSNHEINGKKEASGEPQNPCLIQKPSCNFTIKKNHSKNCIYHECYPMTMRYEPFISTSKVHTAAENTNTGEAKLDKKYIETLLQKITELKDRIKYFDAQGSRFTWQDPTVGNHNINEQAGDFNAEDVKKQSHKRTVTQADSLVTEKCGTAKSCKLANYIKNISDHQKNIYTTCEQYPIHKSNTSVVMSVQSLNKNTCVKTSPQAETQYFQRAAEDFIQQAEDLKNKISFMLECCECENVTLSEHSISRLSSDFNYTISGSSDELRYKYNNESFTDPGIEQLLHILNLQYAEILRSLTSIEQQMQQLTTLNKSKKGIKSDKFKKIKKLSATSANVCACMPSKESNQQLPVKKGIIETKRKSQGKNSNKNLDPVVLIYEPIKPTNDDASVKQSMCFGKQSKSRNEEHGEGLSAKHKSGNIKKKKKDVNNGFVVTYTPNIVMGSKTTVTYSKQQEKETQVKKKNKRLWCF